jgi:hypothetical protein
MAKKSRSKKQAICHSCFVEGQFKDFNRVMTPMHRGYVERGNYAIYVCDKCVTKYNK